MIQKLDKFIQLQKNHAFILPLLFSLLYILITTYFLSLIGHRWNGINTDPDYIHLFNTLNFINDYAPGNIDNPATTLHFFSAFLFKLTYFFRTLPNTNSSIIKDVLLNPDIYISVCSLFYIAVISICIFRFAQTVLNLQRNSDGLLIMGSLFLMTPLFTNATEFSAQPLLIISSLVLLNVIYKIWNSNVSASNLQVGLVGFCLTLGIFSKFTFLHLFPIVLFLGFNKRQYLLFLGCFLAFGFLFGHRLLGQEERIFQWLQSNLTRTGVYGSNPNFWPDTNLYFANIRFFLKGNIIFCTTLCLAFLRFCFKPTLIKSNSLLFALLILQFVFIAFMAKHRTSSYYFIVDFILLPLFIKFLLDEFRSKTMLLGSKPWLKYSFAMFIALFFSTLVYLRTNRFRKNTAANIELFKQIEKKGIQNGTESGTIVAASFYGNWNSGFKYSEDLVKIFGKQNFPSFNSDSMMQFDARKVRSILAGEQILIHDYNLNPHIQKNYRIKKQFTKYLVITRK